MTFTSQLQQSNIKHKIKIKTESMVIEFEKDVLKKAKAAFKLRGSINRCATLKKIDRTTVSRAVGNGRGEETTVNAITEYIKENVA